MQASAEKIDEATTIYYKFNTGSYSSSTTTYTVVSSAVAGTTYSVNATVKTMLSSNSSREFTTSTLYFTTGYPITFDMEGGTGGPSTMYAVYDKTLDGITSGSFPTKEGNGFDGFWTEDGGNGIQVINEKGEWKANVEYYTGAGGKLIRTSATTLYARWMPTGYYVVGEFNNWTGDPAYHKFSGSPLTATFAILKTNPKLTDLTTTFKVRKVNEGSSSGSSNNWFGDGKRYGKVPSSSGAVNSSTNIGDGSNMTLEVYYNGDYSFEITEGSGVINMTVAVPVVNQLQIYSNSCNDTKDQYYNWGDPVGDVVSKTVTLSRCDYYFKPVWDSEYYGKGTEGGGHTTITRGTNDEDLAVGTGNSNAENLKITPDLKGDYTFSFDTGDKTLSVTFPDRVQVTYGIYTSGGGTGTAGSVTATNDDDGDVSISTLSNYVVDGNAITLTAPSAKEGYTWRGWYTTNSPDPSDWSENRISEETSIKPTVTSSYKTFYAVYSENNYTITVGATTGGSITTPASPATTVTAHPATGATIVAAKADEGWHFTGWTSASDKVTFADEHALSTTVTTTENATIQANFVRRYALYGSKAADGDPKGGMPGWSTPADFTGTVTSLGVADDADLEYAATLEPNTYYKFQVYDRALSKYRGASADDAVLPSEGVSNWELNAGTPKDVHIYTVGYGTYTFHITKISNDDNRYPSIQVDRQSSHQITIGSNTDFGADLTMDNSKDGGSVTAKTTENDPETGTPTDYTITTGQYVRNGGTVVFTAHPETGYTFEGWYNDEDCAYNHAYSQSSTVEIDNEAMTLTLKNITAPKTVYAKYKEKMTVFSIFYKGGGSVSIEGEEYHSTSVGVHTTATVNVGTPSANYYFSGFEIPEGADYELVSQSTTESAGGTAVFRGLGGGVRDYTMTTYAVFTEYDKIYFRNVFDDGAGTVTHWDNVYVYFNTDWHSDQGVHKAGNLTDYAQMTQIYGTDIYWAHIPRSVSTGSKATHMAFANSNESNGYSFYECDGVYRTDYNRITNMFVPNHTKSDTKPSTNYYNNGYWMRYDTYLGGSTGYYLLRRKNSTQSWQVGEFVAMENHATTIKCRLRVDNLADDSCKYFVYTAGALNYTTPNNSTGISATSCTNINLFEWKGADPNFYVQPTAEGIYEFTIDQSGDVMKISVDYPVAIGDYRLKNTYTIDEEVHYAYSDNIKGGTADESHTLSMYLNKSGSGTWKLQKCTSIVNKKPVWSDGSDYNLSSTLSGITQNGVYQFDIVVDKANDRVNAAPANFAPYEGEYYIKTDCAKGGWDVYTSNPLLKNTINFKYSDPSTFDYYYCKYIETVGTNVKCVIANEYCNAVSDTLEGDAVIGVGAQTLPARANVRFSYNSATNELKRAYLKAVLDDDYLNINPTVEEKVYDFESPTTDLYGTSDAARKFEDTGNWIYEMDVYVIPGGTAGVVAKYNSQTQQFVPNDQVFMGSSSESSEKYPIRIVYDFRTNHIMTAWVPDGSEIDEALEDVSFMYIREGQGDATQITFDEGGSLSDVGRVYGAFKFDYDDFYGRVGNWPEQAGEEKGYTNKMCMYYFSFPFDVDMNDIFGLGEYGRYWLIQYYDGAERAKKGFFLGDGTTTFWKNMPADSTLTANVGYSLLLDNDYFNGTYNGVWENKAGKSVYLYFPSKSDIGSIEADDKKMITVPEHEGKVDRKFYRYETDEETGESVRIEMNHKFTDANWNMMGVPLFNDYTMSNFTPYFTQKEKDCKFLYEWDYSRNEMEVVDGTSFTFKAMYSYMVQFAGDITFEGSAIPEALAARRIQARNNYTIELQVLNEDERRLSRTYVKLEENACDTFALNEDLCMNYTNQSVNVFTFAGNYDVAANVLSVGSHIVPLGVVVRKPGTYTFTMPSNFDGTVTLVDTYTGTRTDLAMSDYTLSLPKGTNIERFQLEINIQNAPTAIDGVEDGSGSLKDSKAHKFIQNGVMYILENGHLFDARGTRVK